MGRGSQRRDGTVETEQARTCSSPACTSFALPPVWRRNDGDAPDPHPNRMRVSSAGQAAAPNAENARKEKLFTSHGACCGMCMIFNGAQRRCCGNIAENAFFRARCRRRASYPHSIEQYFQHHGDTTGAALHRSVRAMTHAQHGNARTGSKCGLEAMGLDAMQRRSSRLRYDQFDARKKKPRRCRGFLSRHQVRIAKIRT